MANNTLYSDNSDAIEAVLRSICRVKRLGPDDAEEFASWTRLKLLENDCAVLAKFKGLSAFKTFLGTVVANKYLDWQIEEKRNKFRNSAPAKRAGRVGTELERLVLRDKIEYEQAAQLLVSRGIARSIAECDEVWAGLKRQGGRVHVNVDDVDEFAVAPEPDPVDDRERRRIAAKMLAALQRAMAELPASDNVIFRLKYWDNVKVSDIARTQGIEQKPLYRRYEQILDQLKKSMVVQGVTEAEVRQVFDDIGVDWDEIANGGGK